MHLRPIKIDESVDVDFCRAKPRVSVDIANVCNEAGSSRHETRKVRAERGFYECGRPYRGRTGEKEQDHHQEEKKTIAIHEAGHATLSWFLEHANPLVKVTIVPRGKRWEPPGTCRRSDKSPPRTDAR